MIDLSRRELIKIAAQTGVFALAAAIPLVAEGKEIFQWETSGGTYILRDGEAFHCWTNYEFGGQSPWKRVPLENLRYAVGISDYRSERGW